MDKHSDPDPNKHPKKKLGRDARKTLRRIVFGTMVAGGSLSLAGLTAQAHGNASSHANGTLSWNFDNFVVQRETAFNPRAALTRDLQRRSRQISQLEEAIGKGGRDLRRPLGNRLQQVGATSDASLRLLEARAALARVQQPAVLGPLSRSVLQRLQAGDQAGAVRLIEASGTPAAVLNRYAAVQLDLYNFSSVDGRSTASLLPEIVTISEAGLAYQSRMASGNLEARASMLHNLASAASPDTGDATAEQTARGGRAAEEALQLRKSLREKGPIGVAQYMTGVYKYKAGAYADAEKDFAEARELLTGPAFSSYLAWDTYYLGLAQVAMNRPEGVDTIRRAQAMFTKAGDQYALRFIATEAQR